MPEYIGKTKGFGEGVNDVQFNTYVPALGESANIQNAFELFYFGDSSFGTTTGDVSLHSTLVDFNNRINEIDTSTHVGATAAHGATGAVVGTTNGQILTNKTLTTPKINEDVTLTATSTELNVLDGITASTAELNYVDGVTSAIQTQINLKPTLRYEGTILNRNIFVQAAQPTAVNIGDIWIDF